MGNPFFVWLAIVSCSWSSFCDDDEQQELLSFEVTVLDAEKNPVEGAKLNPWAILSAQGHGSWPVKSTGGLEPEVATTDSNGKATVRYPKFTNVEEQVRSTAITISIDHPDHPFVSHENVAVPSQGIHQAILPAGGAINVALTLDGERITNDNIRGIWSGGRSAAEGGMKVNEDQTYRVPPIKNGDAEFMFCQLVDEKVTHFSPIVKVQVDGSKGILTESVELKPVVQVSGKFSDNVPRPVKNGRVKVTNIGDGKSWDGVHWTDWAKVNEDGTFTLNWIPNTPMQLVAMCDGFMAANGEKPEMVAPERAQGGYLRAQVFMKPEHEDVTVKMTETYVVSINVENAFGKKLENVEAGANPNVGWWNGGSQIYGWPLFRSVDFLRMGKYEPKKGEGIFATPFSGTSDISGKLTMDLPVGRTHVWLGNDRFQMAAKMGRRSRVIEVKAGEPNQFKFVLQPKGLDILGDWEDLCGLVFG